eukprot:12911450-Prorocentrum_lima.AAC.1
MPARATPPPNRRSGRTLPKGRDPGCKPTPATAAASPNCCAPPKRILPIRRSVPPSSAARCCAAPEVPNRYARRPPLPQRPKPAAAHVDGHGRSTRRGAERSCRLPSIGECCRSGGAAAGRTVAGRAVDGLSAPVAKAEGSRCPCAGTRLRR